MPAYQAADARAKRASGRRETVMQQMTVPGLSFTSMQEYAAAHFYGRRRAALRILLGRICS